MNNDNSGTWSGLLVNAFLAGTGAACRLDWRDLAFFTSVGATLFVKYAKTGKPLISSFR